MEFHPCVVFIKETDPDLSTHREFQDNEWHFYGCGDFGNSKKNNGAMGMTDDPAEFIMEINNNITAQCRWLSDDVSADGDPIKWGSKTSFQFRYIQDEKDADMINAAAAIWKNALTWVVNQNKNDVLGQLATLDAAVEAHPVTGQQPVLSALPDKGKGLFIQLFCRIQQKLSHISQICPVSGQSLTMMSEIPRAVKHR